MAFGNLGKKDEYGRQRRVEHRGRYLRASRTGGVALRAQARAAGVNVTANTRRGFRVSSTPMKNTQMALQNGRFVLRGRYGRGPTKMNLSKTGATVSTRNQLGTFNWIKPNRSSAKIAGVQVRGKNAATLQGIYMLFVTAAWALQLVFFLLLAMCRLIGWFFALIYRLILATPYAWHVLKRRLRNRRIEKRLNQHKQQLVAQIRHWPIGQLTSALALLLAGMGRGRSLEEAAATLEQSLSANPQAASNLAIQNHHLQAATDTLNEFLSSTEANQIDTQVWIATLARTAKQRLNGDAVAQVILTCDDLMLSEGPRTVLQDRWLQVAADFADLRFQEPESSPTESTNAQAPSPQTHGTAAINLNTATQQELERIPHLGPERARAVIAMRPIRDLKELRAVDGIGPGRLEEIREFGVGI